VGTPPPADQADSLRLAFASPVAARVAADQLFAHLGELSSALFGEDLMLPLPP
jgi:hypothetical protein